MGATLKPAIPFAVIGQISCGQRPQNLGLYGTKASEISPCCPSRSVEGGRVFRRQTPQDDDQEKELLVPSNGPWRHDH